MKLQSALLDSPSSQLTRMAAAWNLVVEAGTLRRELVALLADRIIDGASDAATWAGLGQTERSIVRQLARAGGRHESDLLARRLGRAVSGERGEDDAAVRIERAVAGLIERGLLFRVFDADEQRRGVYLILPDELLVAAREQVGAGGTDGVPEPTGPAEQIARTYLARDLFILASALRREAWGAASRELAGRPARSVGQIVGRLSQVLTDGPGDPGRRWRFLMWLGQRAGWLGRGSWPTPDDDTIERLLADPGGLPALALAAGPVSGDAGRLVATGQTDARRRQADALQVMSDLDGDGWWSIDDIVRWLASELEGPAEASGSPHERRDRRRLEDQLSRWLAGRWFWLGLVEWGWDGAGWGLIKPTDALRSLTTGRLRGDDPRPRPCEVTGTLQLEATLDADLATLYRAERYLALAGGDPDRRRYGLTPASFDRGVRLGGDTDELQALLRRLIGGPLPPTWLAALDTWSRGASRLTLAARLLLASDRPETLTEALAVPAARAAVTEALTPRHALVDGAQVADLLAELARAGLPVQIDPGLRVEPRDAGRSAALANGVAETAWVALEVLRRLAPEAVAEQRDLQAARGRLDGVLGANVIEALNRRAATIVTAIANRRRPRARGRVV